MKAPLGKSCSERRRRWLFPLLPILALGWILHGDTQVVAWGNNDSGQTNAPPGLINLLAIAAGGSSTLALRSDGSVAGWGLNDNGQTSVPAGITNACALAVTDDHALAVLADASVVHWGQTYSGQMTPPADLTNAVAVAGGFGVSVALRADGTITVWGISSGYGEAPQDLFHVVGLAFGDSHCLALQEDGTVQAWGDNSDGQIAVPAGLSNVVAVAAGRVHSLALRADGGVVGWGDNSLGQINGPPDLTNAVAIAAGGDFNLALRADGTVTGWGRNDFGQTNVPPGLTKVVAIAAGTGHSVALVGDGQPFVEPLPQARTAAVGSTFELRAFAAGTMPLSYQWQCNNVDLPGETNAVLRWTNLSPDRQGRYSVRVMNSRGEVTSSPATLAVVTMLVTTQPQDRVIAQRADAEFRVVVEGIGPWSYQWQFNGTDLPGATNATLRLAGVQPYQEGAYRAVITGPDGTLSSRSASLSVVSLVNLGDYSFGLLLPRPADLTNVVSVAAGQTHSLALRADGTVAAWGFTSSGQTNMPAGLSNVVAIAAGAGESFALMADGRLTCWGSQPAPANPITNVVAVFAGNGYSLALNPDGTVQSWGSPPSGTGAWLAGLTNVTTAALGTSHLLVLRGDGTVVSGGSQTNVPADLTNVVGIAAGTDFSVAVKADGTVTAWGRNDLGQTDVPPDLTNAMAVAAGTSEALALRTDGTLVRWGRTPSGRTVPLSTPLTNAVAIAMAGTALGNQYLALVGDGKPFLNTPMLDRAVHLGGTLAWRVSVSGAWPMSYQWQFNGVDLVGQTNETLSLENVGQENAGLYALTVRNSYGQFRSKAARLSVLAVCGWGDNSYGQTTVPLSLGSAVGIAAGSYHALALRPDGTVTAWGRNDHSQTRVPTGLSNAVAVAANDNESYALRGDGTVIAWGYNARGAGQIPVSLTNAVAIAAGGDHAVALGADATVTAWGQIGSGPASASNVTAIAAGYLHNLALRNDGTIIAWGLNNYGVTNVPTRLTNVVGVACGDYHCLALLASGQVVAWGDNTFGQTNVPVGLSNVVGIAGGEYHSLALLNDGSVVAWGQSTAGQTKVPSGLAQAAAVAAGRNFSLALIGNTAPVLHPPAPVQRVRVGSGLVLTVAASGAWPMSYQWQFNGHDLPGATNEALWFTNVLPTQAGGYTLRASNALGVVTSGKIDLQVLSVILTVQPQPQVAFLGQTVRFAVGVDGLGPFGYQWMRNGKDLADQTNSVLTLSNIDPSADAMYAVKVHNPYVEVQSQPARLSVGAIAAWGDNYWGQTNVVAGLTNVFAIAAGSLHALALRADGTVAVWGSTNFPGMLAPEGLTNAAAIAAGPGSSYAFLPDRSVVLWGGGVLGTGNIGGLSNAVSITERGIHGLALLNDGRVVGWGLQSGVYGIVPTSLTNASGVAAGYYHLVLLRNDGTVVTWGGDRAEVTTAPPGLTNVMAVAAGDYHTLALLTDGSVAAWGDNSAGQTNVPPGLSNVVAIAAGASHNLALKADGTVVAWGRTNEGQTIVPAGLASVTAIAAGDAFSLALVGNTTPALQPALTRQWADAGASLILHLRATGTPPLSYQWQFDGVDLPDATNGCLVITNIQPPQAGGYAIRVSNPLGSVTSAATDVQVRSLRLNNQPQDGTAWAGGSASFNVDVAGTGPFEYQWLHNGNPISRATNASLVLTNVQSDDGGAYAVNVRNAYGTSRSQDATLKVISLAAWGMYDPTVRNSAMAGASNVVALGAGYQYILSLKRDGRLTAWSAYGTYTNGLEEIIAIAGGDGQCLALGRDGQLAWWNWRSLSWAPEWTGLSNVVAVASGDSSMALQADGTVVTWWDDPHHPTPGPSGWNHVRAIAAGHDFFLALKTDGSVAAWGDGSKGQTAVPPTATNLTAVAAGWYHALALRADGTVIGWGDDSAGQVEIPAGLSNVVAISAGSINSLALRADGSVVAWGQTELAETNVPGSLPPASAIACGDGFDVVALGEEAPLITSPMLDRTVGIGWSLDLLASAAGTPPFTYQWERDGQELPGATNAVLAISAIRPEQAGTYRVRINNRFGSATSDGARVEVPPILIVQQPSSAEPYRHESATFQVTAVTGGPTSYQWLHDGVELAGRTNTVLELADLGPLDSGKYAVVIREGTNVVQSAEASLTVITWWTSEVLQLGGLPWSGSPTPADLTNVVGVAQGTVASFALLADGTVRGWGEDWGGQLEIPAGLTNVVALSVAPCQGLALREDGTVVAWGDNSYRQANVPPGLSNVIAVCASARFSLGLQEDGHLTFWGGWNSAIDMSGLEAAAAAWPALSAVQAGSNYIVGLTREGTVLQCKDWVNTQVTLPAGLTNIADISAGENGAIALRADGTVVTWGDEPIRAPAGLANVVKVAMGTEDALAQCADGSVRGWGVNFYGESSPPDLTNAVAIAAGAYHSLVLCGKGPPALIGHKPAQSKLGDGRVLLRGRAVGSWPLAYQWRLNGTNIAGATNATLVLAEEASGDYSLSVSNQFGDTTSGQASVRPTSVPPTVSRPVDQSVFMGGTASFSAVVEGTGPFSYQWLFNGANLPGVTNATLVLTNASLTQAGQYALRVTDPYGHATSDPATLAVGRVAAWGAAAGFGGSAVTNPLPAGLTDIVEVAAGGTFDLALRLEGTVVAWGGDFWGQTNVPPELTNVVGIAAGFSHGLALKPDGHLQAWGFDPVAMNVPADATNIVALAGGMGGGTNHSVALRTDGTVVAWGLNYSGQASVPAGLTNVVAVTAGGLHTLALKAAGTVVAWGDNAWGQLNAPANLTNAVAVAAGHLHSLALRADGTVVAWGHGAYGETNVPAGLTNVVAVAAGDYHNVALRADGTIVLWGDDMYGQLKVPLGLRNVMAISASGNHSLALIGEPVAAPRLGGLTRADGNWRISVPTSRGSRYRLEYKDALNSPWRAFPLPAIPGDGTFRILSDPTVAPGERFYRVHVE